MKDTEEKFIDIFLIVCIIIVILLKCFNIIKLSWLWLSAIIWIPFLIGCAFAVCAVLIAIIANLIELIKEKRK